MGIAPSDLSREAAESFATPVAQADGFDDQSELGSHPKRFKTEPKLISAARLRLSSQTVPGSSCDFISDVKHLSHALDIVPGATFTFSGRREVGSGLKPKRLASYLHHLLISTRLDAGHARGQQEPLALQQNQEMPTQ